MPQVEQELARPLRAAGCQTHGEQQSSLFSLAVQTTTAQLLNNVGGHIILGPDVLGEHVVLGPAVRGDNFSGSKYCLLE